MASKKLTLLLGTLPVLVPGHDPVSTTSSITWTALATPNRDRPLLKSGHTDNDPPLSEAQTYFKNVTGCFNPRFQHYEEKNPVILVIEADKGDHKAEVIKVVQSTYGSENPPKIIYINCNLLDEDAAFSIGELLRKEGVSLSSVRAVNFSMGSWFDSTSPTSALAMRSNILKFTDTIFVHGAGNMSGGQPIFGLTTQSDHALVVGASEHDRHEKPVGSIMATDFTASIETPTSAVDLVMKGRDVPIDSISGRWSKDGKDDDKPRKISGTSFAAPQVTGGAAKIAARYRSMFVGGLPGRKYKEELTPEFMKAKDQRKESFVDSVTSSLLASAMMIDPGDKSAVINTPRNKTFDTKGSGFGMPHFGLAERILFDQMLAAQLEGRVVQPENYQAYAPESKEVYPRTHFANAQEERTAVKGEFLRHNVPVRLPLPLKTYVIEDEENTLAVDIPAFDKNMSAHMLRGSLLFVAESPPKSGEKKKEVHYELSIESPDRKTRIPLSRFGVEKKMLWHTDREHPIDDFRLVNFRTRAHMLGETAPKNAEHGWRFVIKTTNKDPKDVKLFSSGERMLPLLEITGVEHAQEVFNHHPPEASRLGFNSGKDWVEKYREAFEDLEDKLDGQKAQTVLEDFINGEKVSSNSLLDVLPELFEAARGDKALQQVLGLMIHNIFVEPVARNAAERLMHLARYYEDNKNDELGSTTEAYSDLYKLVFSYEKALLSGKFEELKRHVDDMSAAVKQNAPHIASYANALGSIYDDDNLIAQEEEHVKSLYANITGKNLNITTVNRRSAVSR